MKLEEIKAAVRAGKTVHWASDIYEVKLHHFRDGGEQWLIVCIPNRNAIGLTGRDEVTLNGKEEQFYEK